jgi:hypothetical protein
MVRTGERRAGEGNEVDLHARLGRLGALDRLVDRRQHRRRWLALVRGDHRRDFAIPSSITPNIS